MSDDETWAQLRHNLYRGPRTGNMWDAVFVAAEKGFAYQTAVFGDDRRTLLHLAVCDNLPAVVQRLMAMGMSPLLLNKLGWNAMHVAACFCNTADVCMVLPIELLAGTTLMGNTPLTIAVRARNVEVVQWMLDQPCCSVEVRDVDLIDYGTPGVVAIRAAFAARKRWTALRAAWVGAVITCAK